MKLKLYYDFIRDLGQIKLDYVVEEKYGESGAASDINFELGELALSIFEVALTEVEYTVQR